MIYIYLFIDISYIYIYNINPSKISRHGNFLHVPPDRPARELCTDCAACGSHRSSRPKKNPTAENK